MQKALEDYQYALGYDDGGRWVEYFVTDDLTEAHKYLQLKGGISVPYDRNPNPLHGENYRFSNRILVDRIEERRLKKSVILAEYKKKYFLGIIPLN